MAGKFGDLADYLDPGLDLPIQGTTYTAPPPDAETGLRLQHLSDWMLGAAVSVENDTDAPAPSDELLSDADELDLYRDALGTAYDEMHGDNVPWPMLKVAGMTAFLCWTVGAEQAETYWKAGGRPERPAGNRASRRAAQSTPKQGSASGTTKSPAKTAPATGARSPGRKSSRSGS